MKRRNFYFYSIIAIYLLRGFGVLTGAMLVLGLDTMTSQQIFKMLEVAGTALAVSFVMPAIIVYAGRIHSNIHARREGHVAIYIPKG